MADEAEEEAVDDGGEPTIATEAEDAALAEQEREREREAGASASQAVFARAHAGGDLTAALSLPRGVQRSATRQASEEERDAGVTEMGDFDRALPVAHTYLVRVQPRRRFPRFDDAEEWGRQKNKTKN